MSSTSAIYSSTQAKDSPNKLNYFLVFMSIAQCGIGFLASKEIYPVMSIVLIALMSRSTRFIRVVPWVLLNLLIYIFQSISFDAFDVNTVQLTYFAMRLMVPAMYLAIVGEDYFYYFTKIIYAYCLISFVFWSIEVFIPPLSRILRTAAIFFSQTTGSFVVDYKSLSLFLLYTFTSTSKYNTIARNAGPFWEPGAFAVYLAVAMVIMYLQTRSVKNKYMIVYTIAMLTTQSTAGYLTLFVFYSWTTASANSRYKPLWFVLIMISAFAIAVKAPFMNQKINDMYSVQSTQNLSGFTSGRFYSARKSINAISQHPFIGRGISRRTAYDEESEFYGTYGIIDIPARFGIIAGLLYFILLLSSLRLYGGVFSNKGSRIQAGAAFLSLAPVYFSQGVYLSVVNILIIQTVIVYGSHGFYSRFHYNIHTRKLEK